MRLKFTTLLFVLLLALEGCAGGANGNGLKYSGPTEKTLHKGEMLPGTDIKVLALSKDGADLEIGGQKAHKLKGDSVDWDGKPASGIEMSLHQRVAWVSEDALHLAGTVTLTVSDVNPTPMKWDRKNPIEYTLPVAYVVKKGDRIPGTTISYKGKTDKGAELGGVEGYPYRKTADSITWSGKLRDNTYVKLTFRVGFYDSSRLQVVGLAKIGIRP
jgi:hypothetical protein